MAHVQEMIYDFIFADALVAHQEQVFAKYEVLSNAMQLLELSCVFEVQRAYASGGKSTHRQSRSSATVMMHLGTLIFRSSAKNK